MEGFHGKRVALYKGWICTKRVYLLLPLMKSKEDGLYEGFSL